MTTNARTCIIATLGPASNRPAMIAAMIDAGVDVFRLNFSHGDHTAHRQHVLDIREQSTRTQRPIGILQDLQGPKIRVGRFHDERIKLNEGDEFTLTCEDNSPGDESRVGVTYRDLYQDLAPNAKLLLDDGKLTLQVREVRKRDIVTRVIRGGTLSNNKGINIPGPDLKIPALSDKDVEDLKFGAEMGVDWVAISFVRSRDDVQLARHYLRRFDLPARLMAKIEKPSAVDRFESILESVDGVMIARGDLGVELPPEHVPIIQKRLIREAREAGKPVVTATQMLESMIVNPTPTRAEASDIANAIFDGTDAVMLSAETASGNYPLEAVQIMNSIALSVEADAGYRRAMLEKVVHNEPTVADSVSHAACQMALEIDATAIVTFSASGATALRVARHRTAKDVLAITPNERAFRQLAMSWGIRPALADQEIQSSDEMVAEANHWLLRSGLASPGQRYVMTAGVPFGVSGTTNLIRVEVVTADPKR